MPAVLGQLLHPCGHCKHCTQYCATLAVVSSANSHAGVPGVLHQVGSQHTPCCHIPAARTSTLQLPGARNDGHHVWCTVHSVREHINYASQLMQLVLMGEQVTPAPVADQ